MNAGHDAHNARVHTIREAIQKHYSSGNTKKLRFSHGSTNSTSVLRSEHNDVSVDISGLNKILEIDNEKIVVEPNVPMDVLAKETLRHGLIPPVVMEFPGITVGGGIQGAALESSSWRWGQFNDIALEYEMITGSGNTIQASPDENKDLFYGTSGSYGSLGLLTRATLKLIPARPYVRVSYRRTGNEHDALAALEEACDSNDNDFVESIVFDKDTSVLILGRFSAEADPPVQTFSSASDQWFWRHARAIGERFSFYEETVPTMDYLFRYDRGAFWMGEYGFSKFSIPHNMLTRTLLNPIMSTRKLYEALHASRASQSYFIQDVYVPWESAPACLEYNKNSLHLYPIWLCPIKATKLSQKLDRKSVV